MTKLEKDKLRKTIANFQELANSFNQAAIECKEAIIATEDFYEKGKLLSLQSFYAGKASAYTSACSVFQVMLINSTDEVDDVELSIPTDKIYRIIN